MSLLSSGASSKSVDWRKEWENISYKCCCCWTEEKGRLNIWRKWIGGWGQFQSCFNGHTPTPCSLSPSPIGRHLLACRLSSLIPFPPGCPRLLLSRPTRPYPPTLLSSSAHCRALPSFFLTQLNRSFIAVLAFFFFGPNRVTDRECHLTERTNKESRPTNNEHKGRTKQKNRYWKSTHQRIISTTVLRKATIAFLFFFYF